MTIPLPNNGRDVYFYVDLTAVTLGEGGIPTPTGPHLGSEDGEELVGGKAVFEEYDNDSVDATDPITWKASVGRWKVPIQKEAITKNGYAQAFISTDPQITVLKTVDLQIGSIGGGMIVQTYTSFNPSAKTITTGIIGLTVKDIISIFNATKGKWIYNPDATKFGNYGPGKGFYPITIASGVISYTALVDGMEATDELVILSR